MKKLKAEWWELWSVEPGKRPEFIRMYGFPVPQWIPDGCFPTRELALAEKRALGNRHIRMYRIRRYTEESVYTTWWRLARQDGDTVEAAANRGKPRRPRRQGGRATKTG